jgi:hypothetical protein
MDNIKTFFSFSDGEITEASRYDWDKSIRGTVETIKCFLASLIEKHKLSGKVLIEFEDDIYFVDYDVSPKQYEHDLRLELSKRCYVFERTVSDKPKEKPAAESIFKFSGNQYHFMFAKIGREIKPLFAGRSLVKHFGHYLVERRMLLFKNFRLFKKVFRSNC